MYQENPTPSTIFTFAARTAYGLGLVNIFLSKLIIKYGLGLGSTGLGKKRDLGLGCGCYLLILFFTILLFVKKM